MDSFVLDELAELRLTGFELDVEIGIHEFEIGVRQRVLVDIVLWVDAIVAASDDIAEVCDYDYLRLGIFELCRKRFNLQETLCREILTLCFSNAQVARAKVFVRKPDVYQDCESVGVVMQAARA